MSRTAGVVILFSINVAFVLILLGWYVVENRHRKGEGAARRRRFLLRYYGLLAAVIIEMTVLGVALIGITPSGS